MADNLYSTREVIDALVQKYGNIHAAAAALGVEASNVYLARRGDRPVPKNLLDALGLKRVHAYMRKE